MVSGRFVEPGEGVDARETLLELIDVEHLIIPLGISERDIVHLETGQTVPIILDAFPDQEWEGTLQRIFPKANPDNRMVTVEIAFPSQAFQEGVRPGFLARVRLPVDQREDALAIPSAAIGEDGEETYVYVISDDVLEKRIIERGLRRGEWTEVVSGLEEGEIILATNPIDQEEGTRVRIVSRRG
ncbi:MAG: efflux RND transporter periplasmic adaptor subunit [Opitutales bacterium]|nr:efflux RND transporter periplasmic adaptor subunit [Opitutales bacterium]